MVAAASVSSAMAGGEDANAEKITHAGFVAGLAALTVILSVGIVLIIFKQRKGLHSKRTDRGVFVYAYSRKV